MRTAQGVEKRVRVFMSEDADPDGRNERLQDIFGDRKFIPIRIEDQLEFISASQVTWLRVDLLSALDELDPQAENDPSAGAATLEFLLEDGSRLEGGVRYYMPAGLRRVGDFLNGAQKWIPVRTGDWLYLVNRDRVVRVAVVEG